jgi:hypothetical protein
MLALLVPGCGGAGSTATPPRLEGNYRTFDVVVALIHNASVPLGWRSVRTWTFTQDCRPRGCTTTLHQPSIFPGSKHVYVVPLKPLDATTFLGRIDVPDDCTITYPDGRTTVLPNSWVDRKIVTLRVTRTVAGRAAAYTGTIATRFVPSAAARAHGCRTIGYSVDKFRSLPG